MSDYKWCHGPSCHKSHTQDRIRGSKGSKVLRTKKVKQHQGYQLGISFYNWFCSQGCYDAFANKHIERIVAIAPRNEPLETPIDVVVETKQDWNGQDYKQKNIKERVDTSME